MRKIIYLLLLIHFAGCKILKPSLMLDTGKNYTYQQLNSDSLSLKEYTISANDVIEFQLFSNDGFKIIDLSSISTPNAGPKNNLEYLVGSDGNVKLPVLGQIAIKGFTIRGAEKMLEEKYTAFYIKPFVVLKVTNKRIIIFPGDGGMAKVLTLKDNNTSLIEALALAGGITPSGKAYKIKLIRGELKNPTIYLIDLSTIEGMKKADIIVQANDIIYVEPRLSVGKDILSEITPILAILSSLLLIYGFLKKGTN